MEDTVITSNSNNLAKSKQGFWAMVILICFILVAVLLASWNGSLGTWQIYDSTTGANMGSNIFYKMMIGLALGYVLIRGYFGFAGTINRAMRGHSLKLMRAVMVMFALSSVATGLMISTGFLNLGAMAQQLNISLIIGAFFFGVGMSSASACATGCVTDGTANQTKAIVVVFFFGLGILIGFPFQNSAAEGWGSLAGISKNDWGNNTTWAFGITNTWAAGIIIMIVTIALCAIVWVGSYLLEQKWFKDGKSTTIVDEEWFATEHNFKQLNKDYTTIADRIIKRPFTLYETAIMLSFLFTLMIILTGYGWGASTPFGIWVGEVLTTLKIVSPENLAAWTGKTPELFTDSMTNMNGTGMQNIGILVGGFIAALSMNKFKWNFSMSKKEFCLWAGGGLILGISTRLSNGCNVGALYTPLAAGSISGWVFFVFMCLGTWSGNIVLKKQVME